MKTYIALAALALACAAPAAASAQAKGDWVLAPWKGSTVLYPGVVAKNDGGVVTVKFDDGTVETTKASKVHVYDWRVGTPVVCRWTDGKEYPGKISAMGADGISL